MFKRKADLSVNVIIVAALALVVLVVLAAIFTNKTKDFSSGINDCRSKQGACVASKEGGCPIEGQALVTSAKCEDQKVCCINVLN